MKVFITGGTTGIGWELAKTYLVQGHDVAVTGRDLSKLDQTASQYAKLKAFQLDVLDRQGMKNAIEEFGHNGLDIVVANAGLSHGAKLRTPDFDVSRQIIETNLIGVLNTFGPAVKIFLEQGRGQLVATASVAGFLGLPGASAYSASKAGVVKLCESYNLDFHDKGIDVTCICPGFIDTPLTRKNDHGMPFLMSAENGARRIRRAIDQKRKLYVFPKRMWAVVTVLDKMPRFMYRWIMKLPFINYSKE